MQLALSQAFFAIGESRPNPAVGAVVVKDGIVVGKGRTQRPGNAHAEVMALRDAGELARGAAIYVTLEPCCHYGRTPPCTKAIIDAGIKQVYFAHADPNPVVRGNSRRILEEAGIEVHEGVEACIASEVDDSLAELDGCRSTSGCSVLGSDFGFLGDMATDIQRKAEREASGRYVFNDVERFFEAYDYFVRNKRTFVEVKCAVSQDGFMGMVCTDGSHAPLKITGEGANCWNHELRAMSDAVLVGAGTLLADTPGLDVRYAQGNNPVKVVWAGHHEFTTAEVERLKVFASCCSRPDDACHSRPARESCVPSCNVLVFSCVPQPVLKSAQNVDVVLLPASSFPENWRKMVENLTERGMHRLMVEPGAGLAAQLFADAASTAECSDSQPLWNRLDVWQSTDSSVDRVLENQIDSGKVSHGLDFPGIPRNVVAKESAMVGADVLTVYWNL